MQVVAYQLAALQHVNNGGKLGEGAIPEQYQDGTYILKQQEQKPHKLLDLNQGVQMLLPVMGASAVQLAHAALGCVRIMDGKVLAPDGESETFCNNCCMRALQNKNWKAQIVC
jgi:hypothetical protein